MGAGSLVETRRVQIKRTLEGVVNEDELMLKVNETLEKELYDNVQKAVSPFTNMWGGLRGESRGRALALAREAMLAALDHTESEIKLFNLSRNAVTDGE